MILLQTDLFNLTGDTASTEAPKTVSQGAEALKSLSVEDLINKLANSVVDFAIHLAVAIVVFYIGRFLIGRLFMVTNNILTRRNVDRSLTTFILSLVRMVLYFILVVTVIGILGINTSSFIAIFASAGVAIGMALSGTLQNFAGGVLILLLKPYRVGNYIEAQGYAGTVTEIQIFSTIICTPDNKSIIIPNGILSTSSINNWSREKYRRIDWTLSISYGDDVENAREQILAMLTADPRIVQTNIADDIELRAEQQAAAAPIDTVEEPRHGWLYRLFHRGKTTMKSGIEEAKIDSISTLDTAKLNTDRTPVVLVSNLADSSIDLSVRAWVPTDRYWEIYFDYNERLYTAFADGTKGIHFPFPQLDVHVSNLAQQGV